MNNRYHVYVGDKRTTVSFDYVLASLVALNAGLTPGTPEGHSHVRKTLQEHLDHYPDSGRVHVSQWLRNEVVLSLVDKKLSEGYADWLLQGGSCCHNGNKR